MKRMQVAFFSTCIVAVLVQLVFSQEITFINDDVDIDDRYDLRPNQFGNDNNRPSGRRPRPRPRPRPIPDDGNGNDNNVNGGGSGNGGGNGNGNGNNNPVTPSTTTTRLPDTYFDCISRCPITSQYNPVCATNAMTFDNVSKLRCARQCGMNVDVVRGGPCQPRGK